MTARRFFVTTIKNRLSPYNRFVDAFPTSWAVYSLKLENTTYTGALIRVRNTSTLVETDVFPGSNGLISDSYLLSLGSQLNVISIYDQTGNGNHLILFSGTGGVIVDLGVVVKVSGLTSFRIASSDKYRFNHSGELNNNAAKSAFHASQSSSNPANTGALKAGTRAGTGSGWNFRYNSGTLIFFRTGGAGNVSSALAFSVSTKYLLSFTSNGSNVNIYNSASLLSSGTPTGGTNRAEYVYGDDATGGHAQLFLFTALFDSDQTSNATSIQDLINDYYLIY